MWEDVNGNDEQMRFNLGREERIVLKCLQEEEYPLQASTIADRTDLELRTVMGVIRSFAEKELVFAEDLTVAELSTLGRGYNLFDDESIDELSGDVKPLTQIVLRRFLEDPDAHPSFREIEAVDGLKQQEIEIVIEELENLGYPARSRIRS
jgi:DNA-binding MarR family transcriptional regulator